MVKVYLAGAFYREFNSRVDAEIFMRLIDPEYILDFEIR